MTAPPKPATALERELTAMGVVLKPDALAIYRPKRHFQPTKAQVGEKDERRPKSGQ